jgi:selenocysteine lyase/cysteine desulfurase
VKAVVIGCGRVGTGVAKGLAAGGWDVTAVDEDEDALIRALDEPNVKVLSVSWVSFETGLKLDLPRLGAACRDRGIYFVVDAIQGMKAAIRVEDHELLVDGVPRRPTGEA